MMNQPDHPLATVQPTGCGRREHRGLLEKESSCEVTLENVLHPENIAEAWKRVRSNKGAAGTDGMSIGDFPSFAKEHWETIRNKLAAGSYSPSPVRRVEAIRRGRAEGGRRG